MLKGEPSGRNALPRTHVKGTKGTDSGGGVAPLHGSPAVNVHALKLTLERIETKLLDSIQERQASIEELLRDNDNKGGTKGALPHPAKYVRGGLRSSAGGLRNSLRAVVKRMKGRRRPGRWLRDSSAGGGYVGKKAQGEGVLRGGSGAQRGGRARMG